LKFYNSIDIALDTFPYNGTTTTMQALSMGVPVIALIGNSHHSRVGFSLLNNAGLEELCAENKDIYIDIAVDLALNPEQILYYKKNLRNILNATISNESIFVSGFERLLQSTWKAHIKDINDTLQNDNSLVINSVGDTILARRMHQAYPRKDVKDILNDIYNEFYKSHINLVNLETVITDKGKMFPKGEKRPYYFSSNFILANLLIDMKVDVAVTANNHAMDFSYEGLNTQNNWLLNNDIVSVGSGINLKQAREPKYIKYSDTVVSFISFCCVMPKGLGATDEHSGIFYIDEIEKIASTLKDIIQEAKQNSHIVIVTPHWLENWVESPGREIKLQAKKMIDLGVDAILGHSSHLLNKIDIYKGKPIIYDMGTFLVDSISGNSELKYSALFQLYVNDKSLSALSIIPVKLDRNTVKKANDKEKEHIFKKLMINKLHEQSYYQGDRVLIKLESSGFNNKFIQLTENVHKNIKRPFINQTILYELIQVKCAEAFKITAGFLIDIEFRFNTFIPEQFEIELIGRNIDYEEIQFSEVHPCSNGIYDNITVEKNNILCDYYCVRVSSNLIPGKYNLYWSIKYKDSNKYIKNKQGKLNSYIGDIYVLPYNASIPGTASGIDWDGILPDKIKKKFETEYINYPEHSLLVYIKSMLYSDEDKRNTFASHAIEQKYHYNHNYSLTYINIFNRNTDIKYIRWGCIRRKFQDTIMRNVNRIKLNSNFEQFDIDNTFLLIEMVTAEKKIINISSSINSSNVNDTSYSGIKLSYNKKSSILPLSECILYKLTTIEEKINYLQKRDNLDSDNKMTVFELEFAIFGLYKNNLLNSIDDISKVIRLKRI